MMPLRYMLGALALLAALVLPVAADTLVLKDGRIIEGKITRETAKYVKIETKQGNLSIRRKRIEKIVRESLEGSAIQDIASAKPFDQLTDIGKALKNAEALYDLGRFDEIPAQVEAFLGKGTRFDDMRIRWMLIETYERQGRWDDAEKLLKQTLEDGREPDKIRAKAHLDIFEQNPGQTLRKIGKKRATEFLSREMRNLGKRTGALQDRKLMEAALLEYLEQILRDEEVSTESFWEALDVDETLRVIRKEIEADARGVVRALPYLENLHKVETSLYRADAIMPGYIAGYQLDLVRTEAEHLDEVIRALLEDVSAADPDRKGVATDQSGRLTKEGREQWREACDNFVKLTRPVLELIDYLLKRVRPYPVEMRQFIKDWEDTRERIEQMRQNAVRRRERTHV